MNVDIASDPDRRAEGDVGGPPPRRRRRVRLVLRVLGILLATGLMLVLLGLLFPPSYWRF